MSILLTTILVGISLSMDAFSLSLIYGTQGINKRNEILLSIIVGIFHFFMPLLGYLFGNVIYSYYEFNFNILIGIIFIIIGLEMVISIFSDKDINILSGIISYLMFGISVSIDSFTTGIGINAINNNYIEVSSIFMLCSGIFTYVGLKLGNIFNIKFGKYSTTLGGIVLVILGISYLLK